MHAWYNNFDSSTAGQDWAASGSLNVPVGPTLAEYCLTLTIADDPQYEGEHGFTLDLTPGSPLPVGAQSQVNITIVDPEGEYNYLYLLTSDL